MADPYEILNVSKSASQEDIRKSYRKLAKETHPDLNPGNKDAERRFKDIASAYDILGDEGKRKRFDAGEIDATGAEKAERHYYREYAEADPGMRYNASARARQSAGGGSGAAADAGFDFDDILSELYRARGAASGAGASGSGSGARARGAQRPGGDVYYSMAVPFLEAARGGQRQVTMPDGKALDLKIPAGLREGQVLRLKGQGTPGQPPGDAFVEIMIEPSATFRRDGDDIVSVLPVSLGEALNGASIRTQTIDGPVDVKVPAKAKDGTTLRLRGKGVVKDKSGTRGDHRIELKVVPPRDGDDELAAFMRDWEKKHPQNVRDTQGDAT